MSLASNQRVSTGSSDARLATYPDLHTTFINLLFSILFYFISFSILLINLLDSFAALGCGGGGECVLEEMPVGVGYGDGANLGSSEVGHE
jgi:hypothetical protein